MVGAVRDRTVPPARGAAKAVVYGLLTAFFVAGALTLLAIGAFRALTIWIPTGVWASYLIVGGMLVGAGVFVWAQRNAEPSDGADKR